MTAEPLAQTYAVVSELTPGQFCDRARGAYDAAEGTCTLTRRSDGMQPSCYHAAAKHTFRDELGACYDFQRLPDGQYRQRYRLRGECWAQLPRFQQTVTDEKDGICANTATWPGAKGVALPERHRPVTPAPKLDPRSCRNHSSRSRCENAVCAWSETPTYVQCQSSDSVRECERSCHAMGGSMVEGECVVPKCRPMQASELPCLDA